MKKLILSLIWSFAALLPSFMNGQSKIALGADVSWITEMEASGKIFRDADGNAMECMALLKNLGMNSIRLRVWVNPTDKWCGTDDLLKKAKRANDLGMRLMIDFHYSDWWADPGKQNKPAAWSSFSFADLKQAVYDHTVEILNLLKENNIEPEWVQVGNETGNGMLWEDGRASSHMSQYIQLSNSGYDGVKSVFPDSKVIIHLHNGHDNGLYRWIFDAFKNNGGKWDVIGMSLYPYWSGLSWQDANTQCLANMKDMISRYNKEVMIVETGYSWDQAATAKSFLSDLIQKVNSIADSKGLGVLYWEPECYNWKGYSMGAFDSNGKPTQALDAFSILSGTSDTQIEKELVLYDPESQRINLKDNFDCCILYSSRGKMVGKYLFAREISTDKLNSGVYLLVTQKKDLRYTYKLVIG